MNIGNTFATGPAEAAFVINELVKPNAVIASHANAAATRNRKVIPGTRTEPLIKATNVPVRPPMRGHTMWSSTATAGASPDAELARKPQGRILIE